MKRSLFIFLLLVVAGCKTYRQQTLEPVEFYQNGQVKKNIGYYDVFVHDGQNSYKVSAPRVSGDTLSGLLIKQDPATIVKRPKGKKQVKMHRKEINLYLKKAVEPSQLNNKQNIIPADLDRADVYVKNKKGMFALFAGIALLVALVAAAIYGLIKVAEAGSDESSDQSSNNSSNGSGCYVATMVYGSYDAPEVVVLRRFRDEFLANYSWGRTFIRWYYKNSPGFVERYKHSAGVNRSIKFLLNGLVKVLSKRS